MPARKTIAERSAQATEQRRRLTLYVLGAIPVAILLVIGGVFLYQRATGLGPDEMPSSISQGDRDDISAAIEDFYETVNGYDPTVISDAVAWDGGGKPIRELERLIIQLSAMLGEQLKFDMQTLGATSIQGDKVAAHVVTNFGTKDVYLKRLDGAWRVAQPVDLLVPQEAGPLSLEWEVLNSYHSDDGKILYVAGRVKNTSDLQGFLVSMAGYVGTDEGKTLSTATFPPPASPFLNPGGETYFQMTFPPAPEDPVPLDPDAVVIAPDFRASNANDDRVVVHTVHADTSVIPWRADSGQKVTVTSEDERPTEVKVSAVLQDAAGQFLGVLLLAGGTFDPGSTEEISIPAALPSDLASVTTLNIQVYAAVRG